MSNAQDIRKALDALIRAYVNLLENGRDRIRQLGGDCDDVPSMEASDPYLREARAALSQQPQAAQPDQCKAGGACRWRGKASAELVAEHAQTAQPNAPTLAQLNSACMSYRHDFGLMSEEEQERLRWSAKEWLHAWRKEFATAPAQPAPSSPVGELPPLPEPIKGKNYEAGLWSMRNYEAWQEDARAALSAQGRLPQQ